MRIEDLIRDPSFHNWVKGAPAGDILRWDAYLEKHPEQLEFIMTARELVRAQHFAADVPDPLEKAAVWSRIQAGIQRPQKSLKRRRLMQYAAVAVVALLVSFGIFLLGSKDNDIRWSTLQTAPGEMQTVTLVDGSTVTLNGNSELRFPEVFERDVRRVQIRGEAFFEVNHLVNPVPFIVDAGEARVTVLGTSFNIHARNEHAAVSLIEGRVEVSKTNAKRIVTLEPGHTAYLGNGSFEVRSDDVDARASWRNHLWVFDETPLHEVLLSLQESFGVDAEVDPGINLDKTISGRVSTKDLSTLYAALEAMLQVEISNEGTAIAIQNKR